MKRLAVLTLIALTCGACTFVDYARDFKGLTDHEGNQVEHHNRTHLALNLLFTSPLIGNADLDQTVTDLCDDARVRGGRAVRIVQSDSTLWWWVLPPFSFILTPASSNVAADVTLN